MKYLNLLTDLLNLNQAKAKAFYSFWMNSKKSEEKI